MGRGLAVSIPVVRDSTSGYEMLNTYAALTAQNLRSLVLTCPGERFDTAYGVGLRNYLFEMLEESVFQNFKSELLRQQAIYIPYINITNIKFNSPITNSNLPENYLSIRGFYYNTIIRESSAVEISNS